MKIYHIKAITTATWEIEVEASSQIEALEMADDIMDSQDPVYGNKTYTVTGTESPTTQQEAPQGKDEAKALSDMQEAWKKAQNKE